MKPRTSKWRTLSIASLLALATLQAWAGETPQAIVGSAAPDFTLPDSNGKARKLSSYRGKPMVLEWLNYDCPFVRKHYGSRSMQALQKKHAGRAAWLSIISSAPGKQGHYPPDEVRRKSLELGAQPTAVLLDPSGRVGRLYGAKTTPHMFVIDPGGLLVYAGAIDDRPSTDPRDLEEARNYVDEALEALRTGKPVQAASTKPYGCSVKY